MAHFAWYTVHGKINIIVASKKTISWVLVLHVQTRQGIGESSPHPLPCGKIRLDFVLSLDQFLDFVMLFYSQGVYKVVKWWLSIFPNQILFT